MSGKTVVNTNVLIYSHDVDAGRKHEIAKKLIGELWKEREGFLSMQVLQEFYVKPFCPIRFARRPTARYGSSEETWILAIPPTLIITFCATSVLRRGC